MIFVIISKKIVLDIHFEFEDFEKNTSEHKIKNTRISEGFYLVKIENLSQEVKRLNRDISQSLIQFYFAVQGGAKFLFNGGSYQLDLKPEKSLIFYNPNQALPLDVELAPNSKVAFFYISVEALHQMFVDGSEEIGFLNKENINKKFYSDKTLSPILSLNIGQLFNHGMKAASASLFEKAKALEILALYFNREEDGDVEQCPFLNDEENVEKIRLSKKILLERMTNPPSLKELSLEIALSEYKLKEGFKSIYGKTVFQFLNDYRLDTARHLLDQDKLKVNDVAYSIGYTNPSHFITAFKKKFGVTPKKYVGAK